MPLQDPIGSGSERICTKTRLRGWPPLSIMPVDQHGFTPCRRSGVNISPAITDDEAGREVDGILAGCVVDQPRFGLPAGALVAIVMPADKERINRKPSGKRGIHLLNDLAGLGAA